MRELRDSVVVITGASSGIGRAAALEFARAQARMVLVARSTGPLQEVAKECESHGSSAFAVTADVSVEPQVEHVAQRAMEKFGRIDVWVNAAAVVSFGRFLDVPSETFRRVLETNFFGAVHGSRAALQCFVRQEGGVLINVASVLGKEGIPYLSSYVASKEAVIGFSSALREEFRERRVHVCTILPASIDTPIWQHGANYTGRSIQPIPPAYSAEGVARAIVRCAQKPKRIVYVGFAGRVATLAHKISPTAYECVATPIVDRVLFEDQPAQISEGNLYQPAPPFSVRGQRSSSGRRRLRWRLLLAGGSLLPAAIWIRSRATGHRG
jgi:short-subunit dehydrogenase